MPAGSRLHAPRQRGFAFVLVLFTLAAVSIGLAVVGPAWSVQARRDREQELLRVGRLYAQALESYRNAAPGTLKQYPLRLEDLLEDRRFVGLRRHLRKLYVDPMTAGQPWGVIRDPEGRVQGVYSRSEEPPLAQRPVDLGVTLLEPAQRYSDWKFVPKPLNPAMP